MRPSKKQARSYRYFREIPSDPGKHGVFSIKISRTPQAWWRWAIYEDGKKLIKDYETIALDDARRQPTEYLRKHICELGGEDRMLSDDVDSWIPEREPEGPLRKIRETPSHKKRDVPFKQKRF